MGFIGKLKNIFYDVEEVEVPDEGDNKPKPVETVTKVEEITPKREVSNREASTESINTEKSANNYSERELFQQKKAFPFPIFDDEEEKEESKPKTRNNILNIEPTSASRTINNEETYERERVREPEHNRYEEHYPQRPQAKPKESPYKFDDANSSKKTFKPTPVISPVYGILDKNYTKEEIVENIHNKKKTQVKSGNVDYVRNKAYGTNTHDLESTLSKINNEVAESVNNLSKEINEITKSDTSDDLSDLLNKIESKDNDITIGDAQKMYDEHKTLRDIRETDEFEEKSKYEEEPEDEKVDNTLEHDLFNLIDSMYESKED